jgi:hypothetical protein
MDLIDNHASHDLLKETRLNASTATVELMAARNLSAIVMMGQTMMNLTATWRTRRTRRTPTTTTCESAHLGV